MLMMKAVLHLMLLLTELSRIIGVQYAVAGWLYQNGNLYVHLDNNIDPDTVAMHYQMIATQ